MGRRTLPRPGGDPIAGDGAAAAGKRGREESARDPARGAGTASARERARARVLDRARNRDAMAMSRVGYPVRCRVVARRTGRGRREVLVLGPQGIR